MLATNYERFQIFNKELCDIDKKFDAEFDEWGVLMEKVAEAQRMADVVMGASVVRGIPIVHWRRRLMWPRWT